MTPEQKVNALQRQLALLVEQLNLALQAIEPQDIVLPNGNTLADHMGLAETKQ
jgi:hypothetical protein